MKSSYVVKGKFGQRMSSLSAELSLFSLEDRRLVNILLECGNASWFSESYVFPSNENIHIKVSSGHKAIVLFEVEPQISSSTHWKKINYDQVSDALFFNPSATSFNRHNNH